MMNLKTEEVLFEEVDGRRPCATPVGPRVHFFSGRRIASRVYAGYDITRCVAGRSAYLGGGLSLAARCWRAASTSALVTLAASRSRRASLRSQVVVATRAFASARTFSASKPAATAHAIRCSRREWVRSR